MSGGETEMSELQDVGDPPVVDIEAQNSPADEVTDEKSSKGLFGFIDLSDVSIVTKLVLGLVTLMIALWIIAIVLGIGVLVGETVVRTAGAIAIVVGLIVAKLQYFDIESTDSLRTVQNQLRGEVNKFTLENRRLTANNDRLEGELEPLKETEENLAKIAEDSGADVDHLKALIKENQKILNEEKECARMDAVESLVQAAFSTERNQDGEFSDREINQLVRTMKGKPRFSVNESLLRGHLNKNRSLLSLVDLIRDLDENGEQLGDKIFVLKE